MKKFKKLIMIFLTCVLLTSTTACWFFLPPYTYGGEHADLYTVAVNNILSAQGLFSNGEVSYDPEIKIIETDEYGRTLFYYNEFLDYYDKGFQYDENHLNFYYAILIMQQSKDGFVYYYEDLCYETHLVLNVLNYNQFKIDEELTSKDFTTLKELNDWNKPINEDKCVKKEITTRKNEPSLDISEKTFRKITREYATKLGDKGNDTIHRYSTYLTSDCYGRELYYVWGISRDVYGEGISPTSATQYFHFAIIFNPDGSYNSDTCITEIENIMLFKDDLVLLKSKNQWNQPYGITNAL